MLYTMKTPAALCLTCCLTCFLRDVLLSNIIYRSCPVCTSERWVKSTTKMHFTHALLSSLFIYQAIVCSYSVGLYCDVPNSGPAKKVASQKRQLDVLSVALIRSSYTASRIFL